MSARAKHIALGVVSVLTVLFALMLLLGMAALLQTMGTS